MNDISRELNLMVSLLSLRFPVAELNTATGYSKGTISNYLSGKQGASKKFLKKVIETYDKDFDSFDFKKRFTDAVDHYLQMNNKTIGDFANSVGWSIDEDFTVNDLMDLDKSLYIALISKISAYIPKFTDYINNDALANIKTLSVKKLTKLERTVFLKKDKLYEEDMILFVKIVRKHHKTLLKYPLFQKLVRSLAYQLEIDQEIKDFLD